jgi:hypothetical protein
MRGCTGDDWNVRHSDTVSGKMNRVLIPDTVTVIGESAFRGKGLTGVTLGTKVMYIGDSAFSENGLTSLVIPDSVTSIGYGAFSGHALTSLVIPDSVTFIGREAFGSSSINGLTSVTIGANVTVEDDGVPFAYAYNNNDGKKAGVYTQPDTWGNRWTFTARE